MLSTAVQGAEGEKAKEKTKVVILVGGHRYDERGFVLFSSLLFVQASRQLADLLEKLNRPDEAKHWRDEAEKVSLLPH